MSAPVAPSVAEFVVGRARRRWRLREGVRAGLLGIAFAATAALLLLLADAVGVVSPGWRPLLRWLPPGLLFAASVWGLVRIVRVPAAPAWLLRIEETHAELEHALTAAAGALEEGRVGRFLRDRAERALDAVSPARTVPFRIVGEAGAAAALALLLIGVVGLGPLPARELIAAWGVPGPRALDAEGDPGLATAPSPPPGTEGSSPLAALRLEISPPAYSGLPPRVIFPDTAGIRLLPGTRLRIGGDIGAGHGEVRVFRVRVGEDAAGAELPTPVDDLPGEWGAEWTVTPADRGISLEWVEGEMVRDRRILPISLLHDGPPEVELLEPEGDLVLARGAGVVEVRARARDPYGVEEFRLEWVHTRGSGESFDFREGAAPWTALGSREGTLEGTLLLDLAELELGPGDVLHLRGWARDGNDVTGPGEGVSRTRQIRVIREGEEMEVTALTGFPLEAEGNPVLSQRMILLMTERLVARLPSVDRGALLEESSRIAREQARLRGEVAEQVYSRSTGAMQTLSRHLGEAERPPVALRIGADGHAHAHAGEPPPASGTEVGAVTVGGAGEAPVGFGELEEVGHAHDADPVLSVNRELLRIHDLMWEAERHLLVGDPVRSVPVQEEALRRIQALREGERLFPRGFVQAPPVDVAGTRGTGDVADADPAPRSAGIPVAGPEALVAELDRVAGRVQGLPPGEGSELLSALAIRFLADPGVPEGAAAPVARAAEVALNGDVLAVEALLRIARERLAPTGRIVTEREGGPSPPRTAVAGHGSVLSREVGEPRRRAGAAASAPEPFVFATLRYQSGNWDSAPLVPTNLLHSLARYTDLPVAAEGVIVDLASPELFRYPFVYLTGHLPVRFSAAESENLRRYVERGGFVFMDDHNHDIDGAFHRTATAELARIFGPEALQPLPNDHDLYRTYFLFEDGPPITSHELSGWGDGLIHPELHAIEVGGRIGVLYSNKDYSSEWSYHAVNKRFLAVDNTRFGVNLILHALTR